MQYPYVVTLKKDNDRTVDFISIFLCFVSILAMLSEQVGARRLNVFYCLGAAILSTGLVLNMVAARRKHKQVRYANWLFIAGIFWITMPWLAWLSIPFFLLAFLEYQAKYPLEIGFSNDQVVINSLLKRKFPWSDLNNVLLKDGLLTLDFKNNKLLQKETLEDEDDDGDEEEFNAWCRERLSASR
jgi:hypothetical protein